MLPHLPFSPVVPHGPPLRAAVQKSYGKNFQKSEETKQKSKTTVKLQEKAENTFSNLVGVAAEVVVGTVGR